VALLELESGKDWVRALLPTTEPTHD
jgi:hypothetical protein